MTENFSNDIFDLPPIGKGKDFFGKPKITPADIKKELERVRHSKEGAFRRWLIKHKPANAVMTPIETSTVTGVPDIFCAYDGFSSWIECKITQTLQPPRIRGTQYSYLKKLIEAGGHAKIAVQYFDCNTAKATSIALFDAARIVSIPTYMFKHIGEELGFPETERPFYRWHYKNKQDIDDFYMRLLLDTSEFI